jgi:hypothetical protein
MPADSSTLKVGATRAANSSGPATASNARA